MRRNGLATGKEGQLGLLLGLEVEGFDPLDPRFSLRVVDFPKIKHMTLDAPAAGTRHLFRDAVVVMLLAIFEPRMTFEIHVLADILPARKKKKRGWVCSRRLLEKGAVDHQPLTSLPTPKIVVFPLQLRKSGYGNWRVMLHDFEIMMRKSSAEISLQGLSKIAPWRSMTRMDGAVGRISNRFSL